MAPGRVPRQALGEGRAVQDGTLGRGPLTPSRRELGKPLCPSGSRQASKLLLFLGNLAPHASWLPSFLNVRNPPCEGQPCESGYRREDRWGETRKDQGQRRVTVVERVSTLLCPGFRPKLMLFKNLSIPR